MAAILDNQAPVLHMETGPPLTMGRSPAYAPLMSEIVAYLSAGVIALWGVAHAIPTRAVVGGFGPISVENRRVITQEWLAEALTMWFIATVVILTTAVAGSGEAITGWVYRASAVMLVAAGAHPLPHDLPGTASACG